MTEALAWLLIIGTVWIIGIGLLIYQFVADSHNQKQEREYLNWLYDKVKNGCGNRKVK